MPFVSGILSASYRQDQDLKAAYDTQPFLFRPGPHDEIVSQIQDPEVVTFSISMWNEQLSLRVAEEVKSTYPNALIVFGGAQCPHNPEKYMLEHGFIDICVRAEGEEAFVEILRANLLDRDFSHVPNISFRNDGQIITNHNKSSYTKSLDIYPSPYLTGEFEYLLAEKNHNLQAIVETNRGCPFLCTFCYWGKGGSTTKYRFRGLETVFAEIEYLAKKGVAYIFNADSNFGMHKRDFEIALKLIDCKKKYGFPEKFRTCWGKNTSERIFKIASMLQYYNLDKGVTLARQSNSKEVLANIKRDNIKLESYSILEKKFNELQVPVYAELIIGLPGETVKSWIEGIEQMLEAGLNNQLFIYQAEVYPNTELANPSYQKLHKIKTKKIRLNEIHCSPRDESWVSEYQEIVVSNYSQTTDDWKTITAISTITMLLHSMKTGIYLLAFLRNYCDLNFGVILKRLMDAKTPVLRELVQSANAYADSLLSGTGRGIYNPNYSDVFLEIEEVQLIEILDKKEEFYNEIDLLFFSDVPKPLVDFWQDLLTFHRLSLPRYANEPDSVSHTFLTNAPEYCAKIFTSAPALPSLDGMTVHINRPGYENFQAFVREQIIWSRKSGTIMYKSDYEISILESARREFSIENIDNENEFKIDLLPSSRQKFGAFSAFRTD